MPIDLRCSDGRLLDNSVSPSTEFILKGVSWYGMEEMYALPQGLDYRHMNNYIDFIKENGFNAIRVPLAVSSVLNDVNASMFGNRVSQSNPHLHQKSYMHILHVLITEAGSRGLLVLLDMHRLSAGDRNNPLWYDSKVSETMLINAWGRLASRYCHVFNVMGADLFNGESGRLASTAPSAAQG